jgi:hypothetical protein
MEMGVTNETRIQDERKNTAPGVKRKARDFIETSNAILSRGVVFGS